MTIYFYWNFFVLADTRNNTINYIVFHNQNSKTKFTFGNPNL